jgi:HlyD family secretion protein
MRQIAKWTFLCVICTAFGFGATYAVAHNDRVMQTIVAMLPAQAQPETDAVAPAELAATEKNHLDVSAAELAAKVAAAELPQLAPQSSTNNTFAARQAQPLQVNVTQNITGPLNAVGVVEVVRDRQVVLGASGRVDDVAVEVGDQVSAGDLLVALDTTYLDWAVEQAELAFESARIDYEEAGEAIDDSDIAVAEANLLLAQENYTEVEAGPTQAQIAAAEASAAAAWAALEELQAGPNANEVIIAQANLRRAEIAVEAAQREYDKIAWLPEAAATSAADNLQDATVNLESARAAYSETLKAPNASDIQNAVAAAQSAQDALDELLLRPTPAELAAAAADLASAEATLAELQEGPEQAAVRQAELGVRQAMIELENARLAQSNAQVLAPIDGTVLTVDVDLGQEASAGQVIATLADTSNVKLTVNVEQRDIPRVGIGLPVQISVYALPNDPFSGVVEQIAPIADAGTGFVTFPVIIRFTDGPLEKILPGMTASATFAPPGDDAPAPAATAEATAEPAEEPTEEATEEATAEATEETEESDAEATAEPTEEATEEATAEPAEEPAAEATATPSN